MSKKNIVLITLDCVRPDHIGCFGYKNVNTQTIDQLAKDGTLFEQAICQAPNTWVSLASIFTGCNPIKHTLHTPYNKISEKTPTIAEILSKNDYYTIGFPAHNLVGKSTGFSRGFDVFYEDDFKFNSKIKSMKWGINWKKVLKIANQEIQMNKHQPMFIWFHYMNTHHMPDSSISLPYLYRFKFSSRWQYYDGKISYADKICVKRIVDLLKKNSIYNDTIIIIFSDHGEELKNDKVPKHDNLLDENVLRILLLIFAPGIVPVNRRVKNLVRSIDIFPTILALLNIKTGNINIDGKSLVPSLKKDDPTENWAYSENIPKSLISIRTPDSRLVLSIEIEESNDKYKIRAKQFDLFNIKRGSSEEGKKIPTELMKKVNQILSELEKSINITRNANSHEEAMIFERLKSLGYI